MSTSNKKNSGMDDLAKWGRQRKARLRAECGEAGSVTERQLVDETLRRVRQVPASPTAADDAESWAWDDMTLPLLAGGSAVALGVLVALLMISRWSGHGIPMASAPYPGKAPRMVRIQYQVRCNAVPQAQIPAAPLLQVSRYEALF